MASDRHLTEVTGLRCLSFSLQMASGLDVSTRSVDIRDKYAWIRRGGEWVAFLCESGTGQHPEPQSNISWHGHHNLYTAWNGIIHIYVALINFID